MEPFQLEERERFTQADSDRVGLFNDMHVRGNKGQMSLNGMKEQDVLSFPPPHHL